MSSIHYGLGAGFVALIVILAIGAQVGLAFIPATMARNKGYSYGGFWVFGFFALIIAIIVAACLTDKNEYIHRSQVGYAPPPPPPNYNTNNAAKFCASCGAGMKVDDQFCGKCGAKVADDRTL